MGQDSAHPVSISSPEVLYRLGENGCGQNPEPNQVGQTASADKTPASGYVSDRIYRHLSGQDHLG